MNYISKLTSRGTAMRSIRIVTGLYLLAFVTSHLLNLSVGLISIRAMDVVRPYLTGFWTNGVGGPILGLMLLVHYLIGLWGIYKKPVLNGTIQDVIQVLTGVFIIPLLATHVIGVSMVGQAGVDLDYEAINRIFWLSNPGIGLMQVIAVSVVWVHGCAGLFTWLRAKPSAVHVLPWLYPLAVAVPVFALLGFVQAGRVVLGEIEVQETSAQAILESSEATGGNGYATTGGNGYVTTGGNDYATTGGNGYATNESKPKEVAAPAPQIPFALIKSVTSLTIWWSLGLALFVFAARRLRLWMSRVAKIQITRNTAAPIEAQTCVTLLDALRAGDRPHANLCSGRGRCGTCAIRVISSNVSLSEPSELERATLNRIGGGSDTRLACQLTLMGGGAIDVEALYPPDYAFGVSHADQDESDGAVEATS